MQRDSMELDKENVDTNLSPVGRKRKLTRSIPPGESPLKKQKTRSRSNTIAQHVTPHEFRKGTIQKRNSHKELSPITEPAEGSTRLLKRERVKDFNDVEAISPALQKIRKTDLSAAEIVVQKVKVKKESTQSTPNSVSCASCDDSLSGSNKSSSEIFFKKKKLYRRRSKLRGITPVAQGLLSLMGKKRSASRLPRKEKSVSDKAAYLRHTVSCAILPLPRDLPKPYPPTAPNAKPMSPIIKSVSGWKLELGSNIVSTTHYCLERAWFDQKYYHRYFLGRDHDNFLGVDTKHGPMAISVMREDGIIKALVRSPSGNEKMSIPEIDSKATLFKSKLRVLKLIVPGINTKAFRLVKDDQLTGDLLRMEDAESTENFKFGVLYMKDGQSKEEDMFGNEVGSPAFEEFLSILGDKVTLKGWERFAGGLDVNNNMTGTHTYYNKWNDFEIVFHVSTMLPFQNDDRQQLERKRHLGNDIVLIVFLDGNCSSYSPDTIKSHFNHVVCVVSADTRKDKKNSKKPTCYKVQFARKEGVPSFGPHLPDIPIFESSTAFRDFFLTKLINAEKASYQAPEFFSKLKRTRSDLLTFFDQTYR